MGGWLETDIRNDMENLDPNIQKIRLLAKCQARQKNYLLKSESSKLNRALTH